MATVQQRGPRSASRALHPDRDSTLGISAGYQDCLRDVIDAIREMSAWLDANGWQSMQIEPTRHALPNEAVKRCLIAYEAYQQLAERKGAIRAHSTHYRLAEATADALGLFWAVYDFWSQCHVGSPCDCEDCTELDAHWRVLEAHRFRGPHKSPRRVLWPTLAEPYQRGQVVRSRAKRRGGHDGVTWPHWPVHRQPHKPRRGSQRLGRK